MQLACACAGACPRACPLIPPAVGVGAVPCTVRRPQVRYNKFLLALLTFVAKCVGLSVGDLEDIAEAQGVTLVVYGTPVPPSKITPELVSALGGGGAAGGGGGGVQGEGGGGEAGAGPGLSGAASGRASRMGGAGAASMKAPRGAGGSPAAKGFVAAAATGDGGRAEGKRRSSEAPGAPAAGDADGREPLSPAGKMNALAAALLGASAVH